MLVLQTKRELQDIAKCQNFQNMPYLESSEELKIIFNSLKILSENCSTYLNNLASTRLKIISHKILGGFEKNGRKEGS